MSGLLQLELDTFCNEYEGPVDDKTSPLGSALLLKKRRHQRGCQHSASSALEVDLLFEDDAQTDCPRAACRLGSSFHFIEDDAQAAHGRSQATFEIDAQASLGSEILGLSQAALDELSEQAPPAEDLAPSSPLGASLRRIKMQRCFGLVSHEEETAKEEATPPTVSPQSSPWDSSDTGLSQAALDDLLEEAPELEDNAPSSPIGSSLRTIKQRRRWGVPLADEEAEAAEAIAVSPPMITVTPPPAASPLRCPASWDNNNGAGFSQAELDAMCDEEPGPEAALEDTACKYDWVQHPEAALEEIHSLAADPLPSAELVRSPMQQIHSPVRSPMQQIRSPAQNSPLPPSPLLKPSKNGLSPCGSPPIRRKRIGGKIKVDSENQVTPSGSPNKLSPNKVLDMASPGSPVSPRRRPQSSALSPVRLN